MRGRRARGAGSGDAVGERRRVPGRQRGTFLEQLLESARGHGVAERGPRLDAIRSRVRQQARPATRRVRSTEQACCDLGLVGGRERGERWQRIDEEVGTVEISRCGKRLREPARGNVRIPGVDRQVAQVGELRRDPQRTTLRAAECEAGLEPRSGLLEVTGGVGCPRQHVQHPTRDERVVRSCLLGGPAGRLDADGVAFAVGNSGKVDPREAGRPVIPGRRRKLDGGAGVLRRRLLVALPERKIGGHEGSSRHRRRVDALLAAAIRARIEHALREAAPLLDQARILPEAGKLPREHERGRGVGGKQLLEGGGDVIRGREESCVGSILAPRRPRRVCFGCQPQDRLQPVAVHPPES